MKFIVKLILFTVLGTNSYSQKPQLDTSVFNDWARAANPVISNDGKYFSYQILHNGTDGDKLIIKSIKGIGERSFANADGCVFTNGSRNAIFRKPNDTLCLLDLVGFNTKNIAQVKSWMLHRLGNREYLIYQSKNGPGSVFVRELSDGHEVHYDNVVRYYLNNQSLVLQRAENGVETLYWIDLHEGSEKKVWEGEKPRSLIFDPGGLNLAFISGGNNWKIWCYQKGDEKAAELANSAKTAATEGFQLASLSRLGNHGTQVFFNAKETVPTRLAGNILASEVWSYLDPKLQSQQIADDAYNKTIFDMQGKTLSSFVLLLNKDGSTTVTRLKSSGERTLGAGSADKFILVKSDSRGDEAELWNKFSRPANFLVDVRTGERKLIPFSGVFSPDNRFIIGKNGQKTRYLCYDVERNRVVRDLTAQFPISLIDEDDDFSLPTPICLDFIGWLNGSNIALFSDKYDLWKMDIESNKAPLCITKGEGRKNKVIFKPVDRFQNSNYLIEREDLLLNAFNKESKQGGFCWLNLKGNGKMIMLTMHNSSVSVVQKAKDVPVWIVVSGNASSSPNYFWTSDFKEFSPLSQVKPEREYNWLTSELFQFETIDGRIEKALLYKPEDFNPAKKYPVIVHYYQQRTDDLHGYKQPAAMEYDINVPWFVSRGYIVVVPDIRYRFGKAGESAYNSIVGVTKELIKLPWANAKKIGLQGHSFGGYETNYIITHSDLFAAAMSSAGISDFVSGFGSISHGDKHEGSFYEYGQPRMQRTLWEDPQAYLNNSPIFNADKVMCPLLMMHNKEDSAVPFAQGLELFTALRRLGKRAWMFQYDGESHTLDEERNKILHTLRVTQFFNHYLKDAPAPKWMTRGIPASMKGIDDGLELDTKIKTPPEGGLLTDEEKKKIAGYSKIPFEQKLITPAPSKN